MPTLKAMAKTLSNEPRDGGKYIGGKDCGIPNGDLPVQANVSGADVRKHQNTELREKHPKPNKKNKENCFTDLLEQAQRACTPKRAIRNSVFGTGFATSIIRDTNIVDTSA